MTNALRAKALGLASAALLLAVPGMAWATGTLAITAASATPATVSSTGTLVVTGTCVAGPQPVKVFVQNTVSGVATKVHTTAGCGMTAATTGKTLTIKLPALISGSYNVVLKQGGAVSAPFGPLTL